LSLIALHQVFVGTLIESATTDQEVAIKLPNVTQLGHSWAIKCKTTDIIISSISTLLNSVAVENEVALAGREPSQLDIEVEIETLWRAAGRRASGECYEESFATVIIRFGSHHAGLCDRGRAVDVTE